MNRMLMTLSLLSGLLIFLVLVVASTGAERARLLEKRVVVLEQKTSTLKQEVFTLEQRMKSRTRVIKTLGFKHNLGIDFISE